MSCAGPLVEALSRHLQSLSPQSELASLLQNSSSWVGGEHLSGAVQEMCIPAHVSQSLEIWLAQQCAQFGQSVPTVIPADHPSPFLQSSESIPLPRSPFQNLPLAEERPSVSSTGGSSPMQVSHPFVTVPDVAEGVQYSTPAPQSLNHTLNFPEGGPVRLTRFVEIPLDSYYARGVILAYMCVKLQMRLYVCQAPCPFWVHFGSILGPFWVHFGSILGPLWVHFGSTLGPLWVQFGSNLGPFCSLSEW